MSASQKELAKKGHHGGSKVLRSSFKMAVATFSSRILGLVREQVMAAAFGASGITDAFNVAYRVPNLLRDLFAEGAFSSAFVPIFTEQRLEDPLKARRLLWSSFILLGSITTFLSIVIIIFAPQIVQLFTNETFTSDIERFHLTTSLVRLMAPFLVFISLAALFMGALNSLKVFFLPSLAPAFFNVIMILSIIFLPPFLEKEGFHSVFSLGIGVVVGGLIQLLIQVPILFKKAYGPIGPIELISRNTKRIIHRLGIGTIGIAATQINILITTILATGAAIGAVSWLTYAFRLFQFPVGILSVSIAGSNLVHFSDAWKNGAQEEAKSFLSSSYYLSFATILPAMALLSAMATPSVHLIFERGAFTSEDTQMTSIALHYYLLGLPFYGLYKIFAPTFFTLDHPKVPVIISVIAIALNIIFCLWATPLYGFKMLALGTSLSMLINISLQTFFLRRFLGLSWSFFFNMRVLKLLIAAISCFVLTRFLSLQYFFYSGSFTVKALRFCLVGGIGAMSYFLVLFLLGEGRIIRKLLRRP